MSIQVSLNGLSFCALAQAEKKILFFKEVEFSRKLNPFDVLQEVEKIYREETFLKEETFEVIALYSNDLYSLVPNKYFKEENAADYLKFNARILETDYVAHDTLEKEGITNVYIPYTNINNFLFEQHGEFEYRHAVSVQISSYIELEQEAKSEVQVYINSHTNGFDLIAIKQQKLLLANTFACYTPEDFIYYILFTLEQLELDPQTVDLILLGGISEDSDNYKMAYKYIKHVRFLEYSFGYSYATDETPPKGNKNFTLLKALR